MALADNIRSAWRRLRPRGAPQTDIQRRSWYDATKNRARTGGGNLTAGGLVNVGSGMGTGLDKAEGSVFTPTRIYYRTPLEILCVESWVARNAVDIPIDDMFIRWRQFVGDDTGAVKAMEQAERDLKVEKALNQSMKAADQYGTGVVVMATAEADLEEPLDVKRIREGDLKALHYFDRYDLSVTERGSDFLSDTLDEPLYYMVHPSRGGVPMRVHASRLLRFDGIRPPTKSGFSVYDQDFGVSVLVPIIVSLMEDQTLASAVAHMSQEASIPVLHISGLREAIAGGGDPNEPGPAQIGADINMMKSIYRLLMLDEAGREELIRVAVQFGGLADLMDKYQARVAAARKIPRTRFLGSPPIGMSATGESDEKNYVLMMEAGRASNLLDPLAQLDAVLARHVGLREPPEYDWQSLLELSDQEIAEAAKTKVDAWHIALTDQVVDEDEYREGINGDPIFGDLSGPPPEPEELIIDPMSLPKMPVPKGAPVNGNG